MKGKKSKAGKANADETSVLNRTNENKVVIVDSKSKSRKSMESYPDNPHHISAYNQSLPMDKGWYGLVVCFASFWTNGAIFGVINSFGVLFVELKSNFGNSENAGFMTSLVGSLCVGMTFLLSPVAGILTDRFGIRKTAFTGSVLATLGMLLSSFVTRVELLYLTYGLMLGSGASLAYTPSLVILGHYFHKYMGLVNGIVTFGSSVFTIVLPLLLKWMLGQIGLHGTMQVLAAMMSTLMVCSLAFVPRLVMPPRPSENSSSSFLGALSGREMHYRTWRTKCSYFCTKFFNVSIWKNKRYVIWALTIPSALFGYFVPYVHLVQYTKDELPEANGSLLVTCIGLTSGIGRIVFGLLADFPCVNRLFLQQLSFFCIGVLTIILPFVVHYFEALIAICLCLGLFDGCFISLLGPIAFDITGPQGASQAIGFLLGLCSIPLTIGPPIAGYIYDEMGTYKLAFILAGIPPIVGAAIMNFIKMIKPDPVKGESPTTVQTVETGLFHEHGDEATKLMPDRNVDKTGDNCQTREVNNVKGEKKSPPRSHSWNENVNSAGAGLNNAAVAVVKSSVQQSMSEPSLQQNVEVSSNHEKPESVEKVSTV